MTSKKNNIKIVTCKIVLAICTTSSIVLNIVCDLANGIYREIYKLQKVSVLNNPTLYAFLDLNLSKNDVFILVST